MSLETSPVKPSLGAWFQLAILLIMYIFAYLDRSIMALMLDPIKASLRINDFQIGLLQGAAFGAFYALFGIPMGWLVDRFSKRWVLYVGMTVWSVSAAMCGTARNFTHLAVARFGVGAGEATLVPVAYSTLSTIFPRERVASAIAIFSLGSVVGSALALGFGGLLIQWAIMRGGAYLPLIGHVEPWQFVFIATGTPGIILALTSFLLSKDKNLPVKTGEQIARLWPFISANRRYFLCNIGGLSALTAIAYGYGAWVPAFLGRVYHLNPKTLGAVAGVMTLCGALGFVAAGIISDRLYKRGRRDAHILPIIVTLPIIFAFGLIAFGMGASLWWTMPLLCALHVILSTANPVAAHFQIVTPPALRGRVAAVKVATQHMVGISTGPALVGAITNYGFHDPAKVGYSLAILTATCAPVSMLLYIMGRGATRTAMAQAEERDRQAAAADT